MAESQDAENKYILSLIRRSIQKRTSDITVREALCEPIYKPGSMVAIIVMLIHELTGINAILLYSNTIISDMTDD